MGKKNILIHRFYRSDSWQKARTIKIASANGSGEKCEAIGEEVHHVIKLTPENVMDARISHNQGNLLLLCKIATKKFIIDLAKKNNLITKEILLKNSSINLQFI